MSQAKVDQYKASKKNRKQEVAKAKRNKMIGKIVTPIVVIAIVAWIGYSGYSYFTTHSDKPEEAIEIDNSALYDYMYTVTGE